MNLTEYYKPQSLNEAWEQKKKVPGARFVAGGTDIFVKIKNHELIPSALISLRSIPELAGVENGNVTCIGAMTTIADLVQHSVLCDNYPVLVDAARTLGSVQIRNVATIGGNLCNCSPCSDTALPLLILDAKVRLKLYGKSREIPLHEFFLGPGESCLTEEEILTDILLDPPSPKTKAIFLKKGRVKMDLAIASVAVLLEMEGDTCRKARFAAGSVAPVPMRLSKVEKLFENTKISKEVLAEAQKLAMESVSPIDDIRSTADYRRDIVGVFVRRAVENILEWYHS